MVASFRAPDRFASLSWKGWMSTIAGWGIFAHVTMVRPAKSCSIRENRKTGERSLDLIKWGLIPHRFTDPTGGRRPINAKAESVSKLPTFREAYVQRRCIVQIDGFSEWRAIKGARVKPIPRSTQLPRPVVGDRRKKTSSNV